jgi:PAS domain S-box-containing protein
MVFDPGHRPMHSDILDKIYPEDIPKRNRATQLAFETGILDYEMRIAPQKEKLSWIRIKGKVVFDENNKPLKLSGSIIDITNEKASRQRIEESEEKFRSLSNCSPQLVWTASASGDVNYCNQAMFDYTSLTLEDLIDKGWMQIVHPDDRDENMRRWLESIGSGQPYLFEHRLLRHDGEYRWQLSRALPQKDMSGRIQMWVGTSTDIDEIKKHDQQKDDFIKMASHELKTPVTTIKGYVQLLMNMHSNSSDKLLSNSLSTINRQISKLTKLITDLLDVTRIETGSLQLSKEHFSLNDLVSEITGDIQMTTPTHQLVMDLQPGATVYADRDRISQVLMNLLTNAIKYSPLADKVIIKTRMSASDVTVSIRDFGIGIINKDYERIFERFYRVEGKDEKTFPGFGIGLFIVREIISQHQGRVWVESEKESGSVFYISLPIF